MLYGLGLAIHYLNRLPSTNGVSHGGVAIILKNNIAQGVNYPFNNPDKFEVLPLEINMHSVKRKMVAVAVYMPPNYTVARGKACLEH